MYSIGAATESADATRELLPCLSRPSLERCIDSLCLWLLETLEKFKTRATTTISNENDHITQKTDPQITIKDRRNQLLYRSYDN